jgi:hypothetical protein
MTRWLTIGLALAGASVALDSGSVRAVTLADLGGEPVVGLDGRGWRLDEVLPSEPDGEVILLFWSLYEPESRRALRALDRALEGEASLRVLALAVPEYRESPATVAEFLARARVGFPAYVDPGGGIRGRLAGTRPDAGSGYPELYVFDRSGALVDVHRATADGVADLVARARARVRATEQGPR